MWYQIVNFQYEKYAYFFVMKIYIIYNYLYVNIYIEVNSQ